MIVDRLVNANRYQGMPAALTRALAFLRDTDLARIPLGRHEIDGNQIYFMAQEYDSKSLPECKWESHRKYWDVHTVVEGAERIGFTQVGDLKVEMPYDDEKEVALYSGDGNFLLLKPGLFAFMSTDDAHMPGVAVDKPQRVRKVVVKVAVPSD